MHVMHGDPPAPSREGEPHIAHGHMRPERGCGGGRPMCRHWRVRRTTLDLAPADSTANTRLNLEPRALFAPHP